MVSSIDEVTTSLVVGIEQLEAGRLVHRTHPERLPLVADAHGSEDDWGNVNTGERAELAVPSEFSLRRRGIPGLGHGGSRVGDPRLTMGGR